MNRSLFAASAVTLGLMATTLSLPARADSGDLTFNAIFAMADKNKDSMVTKQEFLDAMSKAYDMKMSKMKSSKDLDDDERRCDDQGWLQVADQRPSFGRVVTDAPSRDRTPAIAPQWSPRRKSDTAPGGVRLGIAPGADSCHLPMTSPPLVAATADAAVRDRASDPGVVLPCSPP